MNKLVLIFCLCINKISCETASPTSASPYNVESLKTLDYNDILQYPDLGWLPGTCKLPENFKITLKNLAGEWFLRANKEFMPVIEGINPFLNYQKNYDCLKFVLSSEVLNEELTISYGCRTESTDNYSGKCQILVKFDKTNRIVYPITNCPGKAQVRNVLIADSDYVNYLTIVGCQEAKTTNQTIIHQNAYLILSKTVGVMEHDLTSGQIKRFFKENDIVTGRSSPYIRTLLSNNSDKLKLCSCEKIYCSVLQQGCYPGHFVNVTRKLGYYYNPKYSWIILFLYVIIFFVLSFMFIKGYLNKVGVA